MLPEHPGGLNFAYNTELVRFDRSLARLFINVRWKPDNAVTIITINTIANITSGRLKPC